MESLSPRPVEAEDEPARRRPGRPTLSNEALLDKALDLFLEQGFERTSIDAITAAAGVAKRTVYLRYGDKDRLFRAALKRAIDTWIVPVEVLQAAESDDLEATLLAIGRILVDNIMKPEGLRLLRLTNAESARMPEIGVYTYTQGTERTIVHLADLFRRRVGALEPDARLAADHWEKAAVAFLYLVVCGPPTVTNWGMVLSPEAIDSHTDYSVRLFLGGLLPRGAPARDDGAALREENERLRRLLVAAMLENASLKEQGANETGEVIRGDIHD